MGVWKGLDEGGLPVTQYFAPDQEAHARALGFVPATATEAGAATGAIDDSVGGLQGAIGAGATSLLSGLTLGASDAGLRAVLSDAQMGRVRSDRESHPVVSGGGTLLGAALPAVLSGGSSLPAGLVSSAGTGVAKRLGGGLLARGAGAAVEGSLYGLGQGVSELALDSDPLTAEHAASVLSSNMLLGGVAGGGIGLAGALAERGLVSAKNALTTALARKGVEEVSPDLAALDTRGLRSARDIELDRIEAERAPLRKQLVEDVQDFRERIIETNMKSAAEQGMHIGEVREENAAFQRANKALRQALDDKVGLAQKPEQLLKTLRTQEQAMAGLKEWGDDAVEAFYENAKTIPDQIRAEILADKDGKKLGFVASALTPRGLDLAVDRVMMDRFGTLAGPPFPKSLQIIQDHFGGAIDANQALQRRIIELTAPAASERLSQIDAAGDLLHQPHQASLGEKIIGAAAHALGPVGAIASAGAKAVGGIKAAIGGVAKKTGEAAAAFLDAGAKVAAKVAPIAPAVGALTATEVLGRVRFGRGAEEPEGEQKERDLAGLFRQRSAELREQTMVAQDGSIQMRPAARMAITRQLAPVAVKNPILADKIETAVARRIAFESSKIPRRPEVGGLQIGPDNWRPSDMQIRSWARTVRACEDPHGVELRLSRGIVTPEEAEAYRVCYPERLKALTASLFGSLPTLSRTLPTHKKVALFMMTGVPTMPALQPNILRTLQATFAVEPGTAGGTAAPKPMPSFGALGSAKTMDQPTRAQKRGG